MPGPWHGPTTREKLVLSRRRFLTIGAVGVGALVGPSPTSSTARAAAAFCDLGAPGGPVLISAQSSPAVTPYAQALAIPPVAVPVSSGAADAYQIEVRSAEVTIVPGTRTTIWGYDGLFPGPSIVARSGRPVAVEFTNSLPAPIAVHLHGGHVAPEHDGHPMDLIPPGASRRYEYPNGQPHSTLWYHDHAMDQTAENVYRGLAGLYLLHDDEEADAGLPTGDYDVPLLLQDRSFGADGQLAYPDGTQARDGVLGDVFLVNGVPQPSFAVERRPYRFRIVNGSNARPYDLELEGRSLWQVGSDGGLLSAPISVRSIRLGIAERAEVVVDFAQMDPGQQVVLQDRISGNGLVRFDVESGDGGATILPATLRTIVDLPAPTVEREVHLQFDEGVGRWVLDGRVFDHDRIDARARLGTVERWRLVNDSAFEHPFHLHLAMFRVESRGLAAAPANERGWKDTVRVAPGETVTFTTRFTGFPGTFLYHCHILEHEDHSMMAQIRIVDVVRRAGSDRYATAATLSAATFPAGVPVAYLASGTGFADALGGGPAAAAAGGPVLLTAPDALPSVTAGELRRLQPERIVVLGGERAVSRAVEEEAAAIAPVTRIAGGDRYATSAAVARAAFAPGIPVAYVATGTEFPDALAGGAAAAAEGGPLVLTEPTALPESVRGVLAELRPDRIRVLGGSGAVSDDVVDQLRPLAGAGGVQRIAGADRYDTAASISATVFPSAPIVFVATGADFPDALAAVPVAAAAAAPLLLAAADGLPTSTAAECRRLATARAVVVGGHGVLPAVVEHDLVDTC